MFEQCAEHMHVAYACSNALSICTYGRYGRTVRTNAEAMSPTRDTSPFVTRTRTCHFSSLDQQTRDRADAEQEL